MGEDSSFEILGAWRPPRPILFGKFALRVEAEDFGTAPPASALTSLRIGPSHIAPPPYFPSMLLLAERTLLWIEMPGATWRRIELTHAAASVDKSTPDIFEVVTARSTVRVRCNSEKQAIQWVNTIKMLAELATDNMLLETSEHMLADRLESRYQTPFAAALTAAHEKLPKGYRPGSKLDVSAVEYPSESDVRQCVVDVLSAFTDRSEHVYRTSHASSAMSAIESSRPMRLVSAASDATSDRDLAPGMAHHHHHHEFIPAPGLPLLAPVGPLAQKIIDARMRVCSSGTQADLPRFASLLQAAALAGTHEIFIAAKLIALATQLTDAHNAVKTVLTVARNRRQQAKSSGSGVHAASAMDPSATLARTLTREAPTALTAEVMERHRSSGSTASSAAHSRLSGFPWSRTPQRKQSRLAAYSASSSHRGAPAASLPAHDGAAVMLDDREGLPPTSMEASVLSTPLIAQDATVLSGALSVPALLQAGVESLSELIDGGVSCAGART